MKSKYGNILSLKCIFFYKKSFLKKKIQHFTIVLRTKKENLIIFFYHFEF